MSMVLLLIGAPLAGVPIVDVESPVSTVSASESEGEVISTGETDLKFWDRSVLPLRPDSDQATADGATSIDNLRLFLQPDGLSQSAPANRGELTVYEADDELTIEFSSNSQFADAAQFDGQEPELLIGYLDEDTAGDMDLSDVPTSGEEFLANLSQERLDELNGNITFHEPQTAGEIDADTINDEPLTYDVDADNSGIYFAVLAVPDNDPVFDVNGGELEPPNEGTVIGVDQFATQNANSEVDVPESVEPGDDIVFDVNATEFPDETDTTHAVVVYDADTFEGSEMTIIAEEPLTSDFSTDDLTIEHSISELNGVQNSPDDATLLGLTLDQRTETGITALADVIDFLAGEVNADSPNTVPGDTTLNTSATVIADAEPDGSVTVETFDNWTESDNYQWVHVAAGESSDQLQSQEGTISIEEADDDDDAPRRGQGGGGAPPADDDDDEPTETPTPEPDVDEETPEPDPDVDEETPAVDDEPPVDDDDTIPGFGVTVAIISLLSIALLALRRND